MVIIGRCSTLAVGLRLQVTVVLCLKYILEHGLQSTMIRVGSRVWSGRFLPGRPRGQCSVPMSYEVDFACTSSFQYPLDLRKQLIIKYFVVISG